MAKQRAGKGESNSALKNDEKSKEKKASPGPKNDEKPKELKIKNPIRAGQTVFGTTRKPVEFDETGVAIVSSEVDYKHFLKVPGYKKA